MIRSSTLRAAAMALLCLLALILAPAGQAQTISNIASASWQQSSQTVSTESNAVVFNEVSAPASITTYTIAQGVTTPLSFMPSLCGGSPIAVAAAASGGGEVASVVQSSSVQIGNIVFFRIYAPQANANPNAVDSLQTTITTTSGDKETLTIYETGANTSVFVGAMPTIGIPPAPVQGDCKLSVAPNDIITISCLIGGNLTPIATAQMDVLADPYGFVFDSEDGTSVEGATVTLVDAASGAPAQVFAPDGVTAWPSTVTTGQSVQDAAGNIFQLLPGEYRFPVVGPGQYRLVVKPPSPYASPSVATPAELAGLLRPDGTPVQISGGSFGTAFAVGSAESLRIDVPVDKPCPPVTLTKSVSRANAQAGDVVFYTLTVGNPEATSYKRSVVVVDKPAHQLRIRPSSVRIDGAANPGAVSFSPDGGVMTVQLGTIAPAASHSITYAAAVRPNATPGEAPNTATATDSRGLTATARAVVRIIADELTDRMTLIGRVTDGGCASAAPHRGIPGVRVMLEDGSYAITDKDGRYHFEGLVPGDHVAEVMRQTLPAGGQFVECARSTRSAGSAISRFVSGQGGMLTVADFYAELPAHSAPAKPGTTGAAGSSPAAPGAPAPAGPASDKDASGGETDWLAMGNGPIAFLFPTLDHNPRSPAIRVVIRHRPGQKIELSENGKPVPPVAFDGAKIAANHAYAVSIWRGVPLDGDTTHLAAIVRDPDGTVAASLTRDVHFNHVAAQVQLVPQLTHLVADGSTPPVVALRILDRNGRPVHAGLSGELTLNSPYESAEAIDSMQSRALSGQSRATPHWSIKGDDGIAYVELAPTMVSGALHLDFTFDDGDQKRHQTIDSWVVPGNLPWTLVGLAEGSVGARSIADVMERSGSFDSDLGTHARTAFYAKGRVLGRYLLTVAYDSAKQSADQTLGGAIDPGAYYTVFADGSSRRYDAASRNKLYVRIESRGFYALFGDFQTGFAQTQLARYQRTLTGVTGEATIGQFHVKGFGARTATTHRHLEIQGGGVTGPYSLSSNAVISNSETITIQVRDRFRSEDIISSTTLTRFIDYDIDLLAGTITFKQPILSHDADLDPQFIIVDFDVDPTLGAADAMVGGGRVDWAGANGHLKVGVTGISDAGSNAAGNAARTNLGAVDIKADLNPRTELRAEAGVSRTSGVTSNAWQVEAEHHDKRLDVLAYVHSTDQGYGVGDTGNAELGWRKYGLDVKMRVNKQLSFTTSAWLDDSLTGAGTQKALQVKGEYRFDKTDLHLGISTMGEHGGAADLAGSAETTGTAGTTASSGTTTTASTPASAPTSGTSTVITAGASRKFFNDKLQIEATTSFGIGQTSAIDMPATDAITARYSLTPSVKLVASYDVANGNSLNTHTLRGGFEMQPWQGAKMTASLGDQQVVEYGARSFAAFGLAQSFDVGKHLSLDATIDANKVLSGFNASQIVNTAQPVVNGGQLDGSGTLTENFTALTVSAGWRAGLWSTTLRGEYREGEFADRRGLTFGAIRQLGDGSVVGAGLTITHASGSDGSMSAVTDSSIAFAERPAWSAFSMLGKLEFRSDTVVAATNSTSANDGTASSTASLTASGIAGVAGTADNTALTVTGNARSRRFIASFSADWSPRGQDDEGDFTQRSEFSLFLAARYNFDAYDGYNLAGTTLLAGFDAHLGVSDTLELGGSFTLRSDLADHTASFSIGPSLGFVPAKDVEVTVGYNVTGFRDPDFAADRSTSKGVFASLKMKFDTSTFSFLGLDGHAR